MENKEYTQRELDMDLDRAEAFTKYFKENPGRIAVNKGYIQDFCGNMIRRVNQDKGLSSRMDKGEWPESGPIRDILELYLFPKNFISNQYKSEGAKK